MYNNIKLAQFYRGFKRLLETVTSPKTPGHWSPAGLVKFGVTVIKNDEK